MEASDAMTIFIVGQTIAIIMGGIGLYVGITKQLARMETNQANIVKTLTEYRDDHKTLDKRVNGISRTVERHDALLEVKTGS